MKSITQRRIFSLLLSLAMLIGLLPALGSIASAAGSGTTEGDPRIVTTYAELSSALSSGVTYVKLGANINTKDFNDGAGYNKSIQQTGTVQLDLDGYSVTFFSRTSPLPAAIRVTGDLSVKDSRGGGKLYIDANPNTASSKQVLIHAETGSFTLNSGRIGVDNGLAKNSIVVVEGKGDAKVVFNGGKVDAISPKVGIPYVYSALLSSNCKAEFNGGEFEGLVGFTYATRTDGIKAVQGSVFSAGMQAVVAIFGIAWMGDTFIGGNMAELKGSIEHIVTEMPWLFGLALFVMSILLFSQAATIRALLPLGIALGISPYMLIALFPAVNGYFFIPNYPTVVAAINFDRTGTTHIGKYILNHSFMMPGLIATGVSVALGLLMIQLFRF